MKRPIATYCLEQDQVILHMDRPTAEGLMRLMGHNNPVNGLKTIQVPCISASICSTVPDKDVTLPLFQALRDLGRTINGDCK